MNDRAASWIREYGVRRLARDLRIAPFSVQRWIREDERVNPSVLYTKHLIRISRLTPSKVGVLAYEDILGEI